MSRRNKEIENCLTYQLSNLKHNRLCEIHKGFLGLFDSHLSSAQIFLAPFLSGLAKITGAFFNSSNRDVRHFYYRSQQRIRATLFGHLQQPPQTWILLANFKRYWERRMLSTKKLIGINFLVPNLSTVILP